METNPTAAAADRAARNCFRFSIAIGAGAAAARQLLSRLQQLQVAAGGDGPPSHDPELRQRLEEKAFCNLCGFRRVWEQFFFFKDVFALCHPLTSVKHIHFHSLSSRCAAGRGGKKYSDLK